MLSPAFIKSHPEGTLLSVNVQPRASRNEIGEPLGAELRIKVTAAPVDSAANLAVIKLLAGKLQVGRNCVELVRGQTSRHKVFKISGISPENLTRALGGR
jgi:uncharacterized protein (TIGR00251 family)